ncbi:MAG: amino acid permease [Acidobacteriota bacterium]
MNKLARTLGFGDITLLVIGSVIGSGIFLVPGTVLNHVKDNPGPALLVWFAGGALSLLGALTYGELSATHPHAGGLYVYIRDCFGRFPAFLFGWTLFFAISGGSIATLAVAFGDNLGQTIELTPLAKKIIALAVIAILMAVNVYGTRHSANLQNVTTAIKVGALLVMSAVLLWSGDKLTAEGKVWPSEVNADLASGFGLAMISVLWAYEGWQYATYSAGETRDAQRTFPRAFLIGLAALVGIYLLANVAYLAALGPAEVARSESAAAASVEVIIGPATAKIVAIVIAISIFGAANANVLTASRVYYAMAVDGVFFRRLAEVHPRFGTPAFAVIAGSVWAAALSLVSNFEELLTYVVFAGWIFYGLGAATIFIYRRRRAERPYSVPGYPLTPLLFILSAAVLVGNTLWTQVAAKPLRAAMALSIIFLGLPAYLIWRKGAEKK